VIDGRPRRPTLSEEEIAGNNDRLHQLVMGYLDQFPWADVVALEANLAVMATGDALRKAIARSIEPFGFNLGPPRYLVVRAIFLAEDGRLSLSETAKRVGVTTTNLTNLIDGLERDGWVARQANPTDRRVTYVALTETGRERCQELIPATARFTSQLFSALTDEEKQGLIRVLQKLRRIADAADANA
jgi:DNA-binding MarR family transcriptional regulator